MYYSTVAANWFLLRHDVYAKSVPRHAIQNSLTTWLVFLPPLRLVSLSVHSSSSGIGIVTYFMTC